MTLDTAIAALLFGSVTLIVCGPSVARFFTALGLGLAEWMAERDMRAFMAKCEREAAKQAKADVERAAHYAATHPTPEHQGRAHADLRV